MKSSAEIESKWIRAKVHFGVIAVVMLFLLSLLAQNTHFHELNNVMTRLEKQQREYERERSLLVLEREHLRHPTRIRSIASEQLGMVTPPPEHIREIPAPAAP